MLQLIDAWVTKAELVGDEPATSARRFASHIDWGIAGLDRVSTPKAWHFCTDFLRG